MFASCLLLLKSGSPLLGRSDEKTVCSLCSDLNSSSGGKFVRGLSFGFVVGFRKVFSLKNRLGLRGSKGFSWEKSRVSPCCRVFHSAGLRSPGFAWRSNHIFSCFTSLSSLCADDRRGMVSATSAGLLMALVSPMPAGLIPRVRKTRFLRRHNIGEVPPAMPDGTCGSRDIRQLGPFSVPFRKTRGRAYFFPSHPVNSEL